MSAANVSQNARPKAEASLQKQRTGKIQQACHERSDRPQIGEAVGRSLNVTTANRQSPTNLPWSERMASTREAIGTANGSEAEARRGSKGNASS